jgi:predicted Zn-dependent protease
MNVVGEVRIGSALRLQEAVERVLARSRTEGCIAIAEESTSLNLRWANNTLTTNGANRARLLTVIAVAARANGLSAGVKTCAGALVGDAIDDLLRAAETAALSSEVADDAAPLVSGIDLSTAWDDPPADASIDVFSGTVTGLAAAFERAREHRRLLFGYAHHVARSTYLASSTGLRLRHDQPSGYVELTARSHDHAASAWMGTAARSVAEINIATLDHELERRLGWARRRISLPAGRYETLLPPSAVADLMLQMYFAAGARDAADGRTVFSRPGGGTRIGDTLTSVPVTLRSDPAATGLACAPFVIARTSDATASVFDNGHRLEPTLWVSKGVLSALIQTRRSAGCSGCALTPRIDNLIMEGAAGGRALLDMVTHTSRGLLPTCLWYVRGADPRTLLVTGLTRDGVFVIENGEIVGATNNFRFNESPVDVLRRIVEVGGTEQTLAREPCELFPRTVMPPLRIADFNMSSVSSAL